MPREPIEMLVESATMELPDTKTLRLKWPDGHNPEFLTGQFITVYWPDAPNYKRAYSLSSCALDRGAYEVTVKRDGKMGTRIVDWAKSGDKMFVLPPAGKIPARAGTGQTSHLHRGRFRRDAVPRFRARGDPAQVGHAHHRALQRPHHQRHHFKQEFHELTLANPNFYFYVTCTRLSEKDTWNGRRGRIDPAWVKEHVHDLPNTVFYACGPNALVEATEELVVHGLNVPKAQMKTEKWG
jgi:ferredoxin-NADP reductase